MIKIFLSVIKGIFSNIIVQFTLFVIAMFAAGFAVKGIGVMTIPIDSPISLGVNDKPKVNNSNEAGVIFLLKKNGVTNSSSNISLEINELSEPKIFSGIGSMQLIKNLGNTVLHKRYVRIENIQLPNNARADYAVIGKSAGGKISGSVLIGKEKASDCIFLTTFEFYILFFCFFVFGGAVVGFVSYYHVVKKEKFLEHSDCLTDEIAEQSHTH